MDRYFAPLLTDRQLQPRRQMASPGPNEYYHSVLPGSRFLGMDRYFAQLLTTHQSPLLLQMAALGLNEHYQ